VPPADLELRPSPIAGKGVFARTALDEGTAVHGPFNHSCDPNVWFVGADLVTRRAVAADEELTFDYATESTGFASLFCHCETYRCRQLIEGSDWQIPQLLQRYAGHFSPEVQSLIDAAQ
jgi:hypothetical protein